MSDGEKNRKARINGNQTDHQFGLFQNMPMSSELQHSSLAQLTINYQSNLATLRDLLELERNKLAEVLLYKDKITAILAQRTKTQAYLDDCIINPSKYLELNPDDIEKFKQLSPQYAKNITYATHRLDKTNKEQQEREATVIKLEAEIAKLEFNLEINQRLTVLINNPSTLFNHSSNNRQLRKPRTYIDIYAKNESSHKPLL